MYGPEIKCIAFLIKDTRHHFEIYFFKKKTPLPARFRKSLGFEEYSFLLQDVDLRKFQITCFTTYYPAMLGKEKYASKSVVSKKVII